MATLGSLKLLNSEVDHFDSGLVGLDGSVESGLVDSFDKSGQSSGILSHSEHSPDGGGTSSTDASVDRDVLAFSSEPLCVGILVNERSNESEFVDTLAMLFGLNSSGITDGTSLSSQGFLRGSSGNGSSSGVKFMNALLGGSQGISDLFRDVLFLGKLFSSGSDDRFAMFTNDSSSGDFRFLHNFFSLAFADGLGFLDSRFSSSSKSLFLGVSSLSKSFHSGFFLKDFFFRELRFTNFALSLVYGLVDLFDILSSGFQHRNNDLSLISELDKGVQSGLFGVSSQDNSG